jgi:hypothetical protein
VDTYADWLRSRSDEDLRALLAARPELISPVPADLAGLAARAATPAAVSRALDRLDRFTLAVIEALLILPQPARVPTLVTAVTGPLAPTTPVTIAATKPPAATPQPATQSSAKPAAQPSAKGVTPKAVTPEAVTPEAVTPEAASPEAVAPKAEPDPDALGRREQAEVAGTGSAVRDEETVRGAVERLLAVGLVWGDEEGVRTAPGVRQAFAHPAGLGAPVIEAFAAYPVERLTELLTDIGVSLPGGFADKGSLLGLLAGRLAECGDLVEEAGAEAREALERLAWGPPVGRVEGARRPARTATARSPIERLLARGLLAATDDRSVTLPREVALHLRGGRLFRDLTAEAPTLEGTGPTRQATLVDQTAGGQAFTLVRKLEDLLEWWGVDPPPVLRSGGLAVRDLRAAAARLDMAEPDAAFVAELAYLSGLLARGGVDGEWLPTSAYDLWRVRDTADRWAELARAWLTTDRVPSLAGERDERDRLINALAEESVRTSAADVRRSVLAALATTTASPEPDAVRRRLAWQEPRRGARLRDLLVGWTLREAEILGVTGLGALSAPGRALVEGKDLVAALVPLLPEPVDHVLLQADLTAIAPGPLVTSLARELALVADVESTGGATVYRFSPGSVRRALDVGRSSAELVDLLTRHSATPMPQPLAYLIEDVARKHGQLRVGTAASYVRCDDPVALDEIMADRRAVALRLHRLAPTVVASRLSRGELLDALRSLGFAPVAESAEGGIVVTRPDAHRAAMAPETMEPAIVLRQSADPVVIAAAVRALRAGDEASRLREAAPQGSPPRSPAMAMVEQLHQAVASGSRMWIGYSDQEGQTSSRIVEPIRVEGGFLTAYDATRASVQRFALHRITGIAPISDSAPPGE